MSRASLMEKQHRLLSVPMVFALCGWIALAAGGCMVGPDYHPPHPDAPSGWAGVRMRRRTLPCRPRSLPN